MFGRILADVMTPSLIIIFTILILGYLFLREKEEGNSTPSMNESFVHNTGGKSESPIQVYQNHLTQWINQAWMMTTVIGRIRLAYYDADKRVREMLRSKGWKWY